MKRKLLITGFDAFGQGQINPSWEAVKLLPDFIGKFAIPVFAGGGSSLRDSI